MRGHPCRPPHPQCKARPPPPVLLCVLKAPCPFLPAKGLARPLRLSHLPGKTTGGRRAGERKRARWAVGTGDTGHPGACPALARTERGQGRAGWLVRSPTPRGPGRQPGTRNPDAQSDWPWSLPEPPGAQTEGEKPHLPGTSEARTAPACCYRSAARGRTGAGTAQTLRERGSPQRQGAAPRVRQGLPAVRTVDLPGPVPAEQRCRPPQREQRCSESSPSPWSPGPPTSLICWSINLFTNYSSSPSRFKV